MLAILSPAKNIDIKKDSFNLPLLEPEFQVVANDLAHQMATYSIEDLIELYQVSRAIADQNFVRWAQWTQQPENHILKQSAIAFNGEVYRGLDAASLTSMQWTIANDRIRILSGLYGVLRPLDGIQAYRLEMGTKMQFRQHKSLYSLWRDQVTQSLIRDVEKTNGDNVLVNLASSEYAKVVNRQKFMFPIIDVDFKEEQNGTLKNVTVYAKRARGLMARFIAVNDIQESEHLKAFDLEGYSFSASHSSDKHWVFVR